MLAGKRILVVEAEFLVALDMQRILEGAKADDTVFARSSAEAAALAPTFPLYALAIVEVPPGGEDAAALVARMLIEGMAVVATTTDAGDPILTGLSAVILEKPFEEGALLAACARAIGLQLNG